MSIIYSNALASAQRAGLLPTSQKSTPTEAWVPGHKWKFTYDHTQSTGELWVAIGYWWRRERAFDIRHEFHYKVERSRPKDPTTYKLDIQSRLIESYGKTPIRPSFKIKDTEYYDDILVEAIGSWSGSATHSSPLATHPSMQFHIQPSGNDIRFSTDWVDPPVTGRWSDPFTPTAGVEMTMRNTAMWLFEERSQNTYSFYELDNGTSTASRTNKLPLPKSSVERFAFQLSPAEIRIKPPANLDLKTFIVDPNWGEGG